MADRNLYTTYKRDTKYLVYWMIHASNHILRGLEKPEHDSLSLNTTGQTTVSGLVAMSKLIAAHVIPVPSIIQRLLKSIIDARSQVHSLFEKLAGDDPDPELARSNASHKHFIDALKEAFDALGGSTWTSSQSGTPDEEADLDEFILSNKFSALGVTTGQAEESESDAEDSEPEIHNAPRRRQAPRAGKGKKGKGKKKGRSKKASGRAKSTLREADLDDVPLESFRIIEDFNEGQKEGPGIMTDYLVAVYDVFREIIAVRSYTQDLWWEVAYDDLNSAVAAAVSSMAITAVRKMATQIFVDFPGNDSFDAILQTITRGNPEKLKKNFAISLLTAADDNADVRKVRESYVDIEEQFLMYVYKDFCDFITDFRLNRTGKPTKRMQTELANWDPKFNLERATLEDRIKWRRSYTINWLYDLVNLFSSIVVQRITVKGEKHDLATVDWSTSGPWHQHRRLFGLNEFAGFVTSLAFQNPSADLKSKIQPHHVFQLQCIVDSMTVSRGWRVNCLYGHIITAPPPKFFPRRDVDLFLDRHNKTQAGFLQGEFVLRQLLERDAASRGKPNLHEAALTVLEAIRVDFIDWLGETKYKYGLNTIPPSRFTSTNANGLYEYSPFLCGAGLLEGLELAYLIGVYIWDTAPELAMVIHLHNMLEKKGFLKNPVGLWSSIAGLFASSLFANTKTLPTSNFAQAFLDHAQKRDIRARARNKGAADLVGALNPQANMFFKTKPHTQILREAGWDPERVPDSDVLFPSILAAQRLSQLKRLRDPVTGKMKVEETELVRRAKKYGMSEDEITALASSVDTLASMHAWDDLKTQQVERYMDTAPEMAGLTTSYPRNKKDVTTTDYLEQSKWDIFTAINGNMPVMGLSFLWPTTIVYMFFMTVEEELCKTRNPLYIKSFENAKYSGDKRMALVLGALKEDDEECLRVMARVFDKLRAGFVSHMYWKDVETVEERLERIQKRDDSEVPDCTIM
ncbi:unnamed protein product [Clonostachys byssicola]|uniref:DUF6604 domain-containing protein n=1 Tax=Clonostachys byssicola TaxID=160290 RepID=A0A9N9Y068_9HYPO|nr:unnamed protein product [Clonostachys byssicola]